MGEDEEGVCQSGEGRGMRWGRKREEAPGVFFDTKLVAGGGGRRAPLQNLAGCPGYYGGYRASAYGTGSLQSVIRGTTTASRRKKSGLPPRTQTQSSRFLLRPETV
jgi:hypothetical protein